MFWKTKPMDNYPSVKWAALKLPSIFGSTYVCEFLFSTLKLVKSKNHSVLTDRCVNGSEWPQANTNQICRWILKARNARSLTESDGAAK